MTALPEKTLLSSDKCKTVNNFLKSPDIISEKTLLSSNKYRSVGDLLKAPVTNIALVANKEKNSKIQDYLYKWLFVNHFSRRPMTGPLTKRVEQLNNKACVSFVIKNVFCASYNVFDSPLVQTLPQLQGSYLNFVSQLHAIEPCYAGCFLDYLIRRFCCELLNQKFEDLRAGLVYDALQRYLDDDNITLPFSVLDSCEKAKHTDKFKTKDLLVEIFIVSLCHQCFFGEEIYDGTIINRFISLLSVVHDSLLATPLHLLCESLLHNSSFTMINPALGTASLRRDDVCNIPSDCDLVVDDHLFDFKCSAFDKNIKSYFQLLGYSALLCLREDTERSRRVAVRINKMSILNILRGTITTYDVSSFSNESYYKFLQILNNTFYV